jgi:hypothetical protein
VPTVAYTIETSLVTGDSQQRGDFRAIVFGDTTRTQRLAQARVEVLDGPSAGEVARFDEVSGLYELLDLPAGFIHVRESAPGFNPVEEQLPVGTELPREVVLTRTAPLPDGTHELSGMVPVPGSSNSFLAHVKVEILDGPLAGVFTFTDDDGAEYVLRSLPPGMMRVRASYGSMSDTVSVDISAPNTWLIFHLGSQ